jgi:hypothetical protein
MTKEENKNYCSSFENLLIGDEIGVGKKTNIG